MLTALLLLPQLDSCEIRIHPYVLSEVLLAPPDVLDAYEAAVELGQELDLSPGPLLALLGIVHCHPPVNVSVFGLTQVACIAAHLLGTVLWYAKLYSYILMPQVSSALLKLSVQWRQGLP
ncbi:UNVERIFIED_CONTAM: hypothetical protein H355_005533 [Colinus virginianus]|nr:hypothetical protein H355_005533 [Colinus virginianus]